MAKRRRNNAATRFKRAKDYRRDTEIPVRLHKAGKRHIYIRRRRGRRGRRCDRPAGSDVDVRRLPRLYGYLANEIGTNAFKGGTRALAIKLYARGKRNRGGAPRYERWSYGAVRRGIRALVAARHAELSAGGFRLLPEVPFTLVPARLLATSPNDVCIGLWAYFRSCWRQAPKPNQRVFKLPAIKLQTVSDATGWSLSALRWAKRWLIRNGWLRAIKRTMPKIVDGRLRKQWRLADSYVVHADQSGNDKPSAPAPPASPREVARRALKRAAHTGVDPPDDYQARLDRMRRDMYEAYRRDGKSGP